MSSLKASSSRSSLSSSPSTSAYYVPPSPPTSSLGSSASSSKVSLEMADEENITITASASKKLGKRKSQDEDLRILAISTHITELSYNISDIQTRIFEIQELRHKSQLPGDNTNTTNIIDQSLMSLDERLDAVSKGIKSVNESLEPWLQSTATPTLAQNGDTKNENANATILRKHATLMQDWDAVQDESEVLREELKEDKWLTVFRTVTDQADGMMSSLEKAVNRCQEFIWQVHRRGADDSLAVSQRSDKPTATINIDVYNSLLDSYEAKKKHYMPATSKVLSIIDKGVRDRVTKNGETLRRHAESAQRWKNLRDRISRTDAEMESVRRLLLNSDSAPSEGGSSTSGHTTHSRGGYLATPPSAPRASRGPSSSSITGSISPLRRFARKITGSSKQSPSTPVTPLNVEKTLRAPASEPIKVIRRQRTSIFGVRGNQPTTPSTPDRPNHKHSHSLTPDPSPRIAKIVETPCSTIKGASSSGSSKQRWNSSTKIESEEKGTTIKGTPQKRPPSATGYYARTSTDEIPPVPPLGGPYRRSLSRASMSSSRPWSPMTSSYSTSQSSHPPLPTFRPPSRAQTPSNNAGRATPGPSATTPKPRPNTPSHIPAPAKWRSFSSSQSDTWDDDNSATRSQRAFSPTFSASGASNSSPGRAYPRPPSRSMIPVPSLHLSSASRPGSAMSRYDDPLTATSSAFRSSAMRAQTPEATLRARAQQVPVYQSPAPRGGPRPSAPVKAPPSSFRDGSNSSRTPSRPGSRNGAYTPTFDHGPVHEYVPANTKDPLDVEVAVIANSIPHGLLVERIDPPLRSAPKEGEEVKAQYAFSNSLARKLVTCKLTTLTRSGKSGDTTTKKVMCRVGGGWQDLQLYILNRQAGM
ncbi:GAR domain-containing protein [Pleurotus pulmonarius]